MLLALLIPTSYLSVKVNYDISQVAFHIILEDNGHNNNFERCVNHRNHKKKKKKSLSNKKLKKILSTRIFSVISSLNWRHFVYYGHRDNLLK